MIIELVLGLSSLAFLYTLAKSRQKNRESLMLNKQNKYLADSMFLISSEDDKGSYVAHKWSIASSEILLQDFWSARSVIVQTTHCSKCGLVRRHITKGFDIACKRSIESIEGFYMSGIKTNDYGCKESP